MEITKLEKAALLTTGAGASFMTLLWNLAAQVDSADPWIVGLRILFALISFAAFDLVLLAVIARGWSVSGIGALIVTSGLSGMIGLEVAGVVDWPALHAAPALALAAFGAHLMISRQVVVTPAVEHHEYADQHRRAAAKRRRLHRCESRRATRRITRRTGRAARRRRQKCSYRLATH